MTGIVCKLDKFIKMFNLETKGTVWLRKKHLNVPSQRHPSVRRRCRKRRCRNTDPLVPSVVHAVEPLKPDLPIDKVQALATGLLVISNDEVNISRHAVYGAIERPRPDLGVGRELKGGLYQH